MTRRILIWGAGAIGGTVGAYLARSGHDVTFVDVVAEHVQAIKRGGLHITGPVDSFTSVPDGAFTPDELTGVWSHVYLAVKSQHTSEAVRALVVHLAPDGYVLSLQNGLCELEIASLVGPARTIGAFVNFGADWIAPGEIMYGNRGAVVLGELDGAITPRLTELHRAIQAFEPDAIVTNRIFSYLWGKLGYASLLFAQALGQASIADCLARPELLPLWRKLGGQAIAVALAEKVEPLGFNGFDPKAFNPDGTEEDARRTVNAMVAFNRPNARTHSGVWRDLAIRKRRTEVDFMILPIVQIGERHGIPCLTLRRLVEMIHEVEDGVRPLDDSNLDELSRT